MANKNNKKAWGYKSVKGKTPYGNKVKKYPQVKTPNADNSTANKYKDTKGGK